MLATTLIKKLEAMSATHSNFPIEIDTNGNLGIAEAGKIRYEQTDPERGNTFVIEAA